MGFWKSWETLGKDIGYHLDNYEDLQNEGIFED